MTLPPRVASPTDTQLPAWCARENLAATHVVAHDAVARAPRERAAMLAGLGIGRIVWDWAEENLPNFAAELDALRAHGIELAGIWTPTPVPSVEEPDYSHRFGVVPARLKALMVEAAQRGLRPDVWTQVSFGMPGEPRELSPVLHRAEVARAAEHLVGLAKFARGHGMCVVLTNHGGWAGEPSTLLDIVSELNSRGITNVGIGLRLQHAHHLIPDLDRHITALGEHLVAIVLSGADAGAELSGRLVLPFGAGSRDRWVTHAILDSGWQGQLLIHAVGRDDAAARLLDSIEGWEWSLDRYLHKPRPRPLARILEPSWPPRSPAALPSRVTPVAQPALTPALAPAPQAAPALTPGLVPALPVRVATPATVAAPEPVPAAASVRPASAQAAAQFFAAVTAPPRPSPAALAIPTSAPTGGSAAAPSPLGAVPAHDHSVIRRAAPLDRGPAPAPDLGMSRRERRAAREQHEAAARRAARASRDEQRAAAREPVRIGHGEVRIVAPDPYTGALHALLLHLEDEGFTGAPRSFGWDDQGRHLVEFVPGMRADHPHAPEDALEPARIGRFLRDMHDALASFEPPEDAKWFDGIPAPGGELIVHHDIAPSNIVVRADGSLVAIDWDAAGPGTRLWDLAYAAHAFVPLYRQGADAMGSARRLRLLVDGYGLTAAQREELVPLLAARSQRMYDYLDLMRTTGQSPWVELWQKGVGTVWRSDAQWIADNSGLWRDALLS